MPSAVESQLASERAIGLRMRRDLEIRPQQFSRENYWVVKDPVALRYFHLRQEEHFVLTMLDGRISLERLQSLFQRKFAPRTIDIEELHGFLATLHAQGLLVADSADQAERLLERRDIAARRQRYQSLLNVLAIRFRGFNPRASLDWLYPKTRWVFSAGFAAAGAVLVAVALLLVVVEFDTFRSRLSDVPSILSASNLPWLLLVLAVIKILHELGHALACRHFGGECNEIGVMLLVFVPCLYCDVSDSWMLASKWRRIAIAAAGIVEELLLAAACTLLWWWSVPGLFNSLCLNVMVVCSLGTLLVNGNPLLRYDGYYILSDLAEAPNLGSRSMAQLRRVLAHTCLGLELPAVAQTPREARWLVLYAVASSIYRVMLVVGILWWLRQLARPYRLQPLVALLACATLAAMFGPMLGSASRAMRDPTFNRRVAPTRAAVSAVIALALIAAFLFVKLPMRVAAPLVVEYRDAQRVYVTVPGVLKSAVSTGQAVVEGQVIAQLASPQMQLQVAKLTSQRDRQRLYVANIEAQQLQGTLDGAEIPAAKAALADVQQRLNEFQRDAAQLTIVAPAAGTVLPPPALAPDPPAGDKLAMRFGAPLDSQNLGTHLETGTLVCLVGDPQRVEAILHVEQSGIDLVAVGQHVKMMLDHLPGDTFSGTVIELARLDLEVMPRELAAAGDLPSRTDEHGVAHPLDNWYQARVQFDQPPKYVLGRVHGEAKISVARQSLGSQLARYLKQTFAR